ncbi:MAG: tetratricopeptide repeat protein [Candidatus Omnitrophica bacterium]|nr:tetratricopeptide repeat protein [Candidatus Omnitrophota bacterium]
MPNFLKKIEFKFIILFFLLGVIIYSNSVQNPFIWDDECLVVNNDLIKDWKYLGEIFKSELTYGEVHYARSYRPIQTIVYACIYHLFGLNSFCYHCINIITFCLNALLVYFLIFSISKDKITALLTSLFFIAHPIYTESVTYISGLADLLVGVFSILCLVLFIKYTEYKGIKRTFFYWVSVSTFILALLSKEIAIVLPIIFILYDLIFKRSQLDSFLSIIKKYSAFFLITLIYIYLRLTVLKFSDVPLPTANFSFYERFLIFFNVINSYFWLLLFPINLHMSRGYYLPRILFDIPTICSLIGLIIVILFIGYSYRRSREIFFFCIWFFIFLIPQSALFFPMNAFMAEHFLYLPAICFFFILTKTLMRICSKRGLILITTLIVCFYSTLTFARNYEWRDPIFFYKKIIKLSPKSWAAYNNLGKLYLDKKEYIKASIHLKESLRLYDSQIAARDNLAIVYGQQGKHDEAIMQYKEILKTDPPIYKAGEIHHNVGILYHKMKKYDMAIEEYGLALKINPKSSFTYYNLALTYFKKGLAGEMIINMEKSLGLSYLPSELGSRSRPSKQKYLKTFDFDNRSNYLIYTELGVLYSKYELYDAAKKAFQLAIELNPDFADSYYNLGVLYWQQGNFDQSSKFWRKTLRINPNHLLAKEWLENLKIINK